MLAIACFSQSNGTYAVIRDLTTPQPATPLHIHAPSRRSVHLWRDGEVSEARTEEEERKESDGRTRTDGLTAAAAAPRIEQRYPSRTGGRKEEIGSACKGRRLTNAAAIRTAYI